MLPHPLRRYALVALTSLLLIAVLISSQVTALAAPLRQSLDFGWNVPSGTVTGQPGQSNVQFTATLNNRGSTEDFTVRVDKPGGWSVDVLPNDENVNILTNGSQSFTFFVSVPITATSGSYNIDIEAYRESDSDATTTAGLRLIANIVIPTATPVPTAAPPTAVPTRGALCTDGFEFDNNPASARRIDVQQVQEHTICGIGDEDWLFFGGVANKIYMLDIIDMVPGIDLSIEIFDAQFNSIAFNDDFFLRDPAAPNPGDTRPRVQLRVPVDGIYYVRIRDTAGRGGTSYYYQVVLQDLSVGPTPAPVASLCQDLFEPDGLPEQARLLTSNEIHESRRLCPTGDADWVVFFAKQGKRYVIYTDTRRYTGSNIVNGVTLAGADTVLVLADRNGVSLLDVNDDMPGGGTLDSQIDFTPSADGFYFIQVKNVGDIGNQFIRYDLALLLCTPGQTDCGRPAAPLPGLPFDPMVPRPTGTPVTAPQIPTVTSRRPAERSAALPMPVGLFQGS
jgi:hypothetical protein